jgi:DNA-binding GntR family transcriptional regulator
MSHGDAAPVRRVRAYVGLQAQARTEIKSAIIEGRLEAGSLTSVRALAELLGMSRTPVREALVDLANDGLVQFERNRGVRVQATQIHDIEEIFDLRLMLEVPAVRRAVPLCTPAEIETLERELGAMEARLDNETDFMHHDRAFHDVLLQTLGNARLVQFVDGLRDQTQIRGFSTVGRSRPLREIVTEHRRILRAVKRGDAEAAADAMQKHIERTFQLLRSQEDSWRASNQPQPETESR